MKKSQPETAYGLPVVNGRVRCVVTQTFGIYRAGRRFGFTPAQIERELQRPGNLGGPRYQPDTGKGGREDLTRIPGVTAADQQRLYDRGIIRADQVAMVHELQAPEVQAALVSYFNSDPNEEGRRRKALSLFHENVGQQGLAATLLKSSPVPDLQSLNDALVALGEGDISEEDLGALGHLEDVKAEDLDGLAASLQAAYAKAVGNPGNRKPETLARGIVAALQG